MNQNENLLDELHKAASMGGESIDLLLPKVDDESLRAEVAREGERYRVIARKAEEMLHAQGRTPKKDPPVSKAMLWSSVQMNTIADHSPAHLAEMMINGTTMGIVDVTKKLNQLENADAGARSLAEEYISGGQENIETLKRHLC